MTKYFGAHGRFCASHPWEVIVTIVTLTVCALSMSVLSGGKVGTVCGIQKPCQPKPTDQEVSSLFRGLCVCARENECERVNILPISMNFNLCTLYLEMCVHIWHLASDFQFCDYLLQKSDTVMLLIVNSLAVIYIYNQFSSLRKAGSKYLLGQQFSDC